MKWVLVIFLVGGNGGVAVEKIPYPTEIGCRKAATTLMVEQEHRFKENEQRAYTPMNVMLISTIGVAGSCLKFE